MDNLIVPHTSGVIKYNTLKSFVVFSAPAIKYADITAVMSEMVNIIDEHMEQYARDIGALVKASDDAKRRIRPGPVLISPDAGMSLLNTASQRAERFFDRLGEWQGFGRISVVMPYAIVRTKDNDVDLNESNPYVNGMLITGWNM